MKLLIISALVGITSIVAPTVLQSAPSVYAAGSKDQVLQGVGDTGNCDTKDCADKKVDNLIATIVNILSYIIGVVAVIMIMIGGFKYITSNGDSGGVAGAKSTIVYALVGLAVAVLAQFLVRLVLTTANR